MMSPPHHFDWFFVCACGSRMLCCRPDLLTMLQRHKAMAAIDSSIDSFSDPTMQHILPFPLSFPPLPIDRFTLTADSTFHFMGREAFRSVFDLWQKADTKKGLLVMNVYGTPGYGKVGHTLTRTERVGEREREAQTRRSLIFAHLFFSPPLIRVTYLRHWQFISCASVAQSSTSPTATLLCWILLRHYATHSLLPSSNIRCIRSCC